MQEELPHARHLQQFLPPLPIVVPLPPFLTGNGGFGSFGGGSGQGNHRGSTSLQANSSANGNCTATWAGECFRCYQSPCTCISAPMQAYQPSQQLCMSTHSAYAVHAYMSFCLQS